MSCTCSSVTVTQTKAQVCRESCLFPCATPCSPSLPLQEKPEVVSLVLKRKQAVLEKAASQVCLAALEGVVRNCLFALQDAEAAKKEAKDDKESKEGKAAEPKPV